MAITLNNHVAKTKILNKLQWNLPQRNNKMKEKLQIVGKFFIDPSNFASEIANSKAIKIVVMANYYY